MVLFSRASSLPLSSKRCKRRSRGQASMEYVFILALVLGFVVALMITSIRESELNMATGSARVAAVYWTAGNSSFYLASLETAQLGGGVNFSPVIYSWAGGANGGRLQTLPSDLKKQMITAVQKTVAPLSPPPATTPTRNCFKSTNFEYCVVDSIP
ncbi:MAG: hypothetical protein V1817_00945 [Candidatus Micrarchaeota archaeon]